MDLEKYTPIKDRYTKEPVFLGDLVENEKSQCGFLVWDEYWNKYIIKTESGGNIYAVSYKKIKDFYKNEIDTTSVECRRMPHKKKW
jgi:hypothetical protein